MLIPQELQLSRGIVGFLIWAIEKINGVNDTYLIQRP